MTELEVLSAYDEKPLQRLRMHSRSECETFLAQARALHEDRSKWLSKSDRLAILRRTVALIESRVEELALQAAQEGGKPLVDSRVEVLRAIEGIETAIAALRLEAGSEVPMGLSQASEERLALTYREPRGPVFAVSAFNHPFNLIVHQVIPAVAVGAPVLVKPATTTPLSCLALVKILKEAGLPEEWCRVVLCDNETASWFVSDERTAFLTFIGSAKVGWMLRSRLAPGAACALEHGGVAPVIVDGTADLDEAVPRLIKGGFYHAGQVCVSVQRIYVHETLREKFVQKLVGGVESLKVGDPTLEETDVGPLILPSEVDRVADWVSEAEKEGALVACGGRALGRTTYAPTVLVDPAQTSKVSTQEIFGPVCCVYGYSDIDDAIARANAANSYFQSAIFTKNFDVAMNAFRRLNGMAVMVNDHTAFRVDWMPFGGHRSSGLGVGGIQSSMRDMSLERMVVFRASGL